MRSNSLSVSTVPVSNFGSEIERVYFRPQVAFLATDGISWYMLKISPSSMASDSMQYW
ncbi:hypothetical protein D3C84_1279680 [compost metagenome]